MLRRVPEIVIEKSTVVFVLQKAAAGRVDRESIFECLRTQKRPNRFDFVFRARRVAQKKLSV